MHQNHGGKVERAAYDGGGLICMDQSCSFYGGEVRGSAAATVQGAVEVAGANVLSTGSRCGDADRDRVLSFLSTCHSDGYLSADEFHARMNVVAEADSRTKLNAVTADLPPLEVKRELEHNTKVAMKALLGLGASAFTAVGAPVLIYNLAGYTHMQQGVGMQFGHSPWAIAFMVFAAIAGLVGGIASVVFWTESYE